MSTTQLQGRADLAHARDALAALIENLRGRDERHEHPVVAAVGELQIRVDAADALQPEARDTPVEAIVFRLAAAEAARLADRLLVELAGRALPRPLPGAGVPSLLRQRQQLGDHLLNGESLG